MRGKGNRSISFFFKSITFEFARGQQSTSVQIAVASLVGHCEIARSFFRDWWTKKKKKKEPRLFCSIHYSSFTFSELKGNPNFISMIRSRLHVDEILLFFSTRKPSFNARRIFNFDRRSGRTIGYNLVPYLCYVLKLKIFENFNNIELRNNIGFYREF